MTTTDAPAKFWTITQNNSGGIFDDDPEKGIGYAVCVEARTKDEAIGRLERIIDSYPASYDCPCCGDRWSVYFFDDEGDDEPSLFGEPLRGGWGIPSYVHFLDGRIEARETEAA
jgi:hypothetical protein